MQGCWDDLGDAFRYNTYKKKKKKPTCTSLQDHQGHSKGGQRPSAESVMVRKQSSGAQRADEPNSWNRLERRQPFLATHFHGFGGKQAIKDDALNKGVGEGIRSLNSTNQPSLGPNFSAA